MDKIKWKLKSLFKGNKNNKIGTSPIIMTEQHDSVLPSIMTEPSLQEIQLGNRVATLPDMLNDYEVSAYEFKDINDSNDENNRVELSDISGLSVVNSPNIDDDSTFIKNDLKPELSDIRLSRKSLFCTEPHDIRHKQPIMGKNALLIKRSAHAPDSVVVHNIILNKYENILKYYFDRMYNRRKSKSWNVEDDNGSDNCSTRYSPSEISSMHTSDENINGETFFENKLEPAPESNTGYVEDTNLSTVSTCSIDVISDCTDFDPATFLWNALGDVTTSVDEERCNCPTDIHVCEGSVGTSHISSLMSKNSYQKTSPRKYFKRKKDQSSSTEDHETQNDDSIIDKCKQELSAQQSIIFQTSKALNYCKASKEFFTGKERIEAERILLLATIKKEALIDAIDALESDSDRCRLDCRCLGEMKFFDITFYLNENTEQEKPRNYEEHFLVVLRCGKTVLASNTLEANDTVCIPAKFTFSSVPANVEVWICLYSLILHKEDSNQAASCPSPRRALKCNKNKRNDSIVTESVSFNALGHYELHNFEINTNLRNDGTLHLKLHKIDSSSSLQERFELRVERNFTMTNKTFGFLTLGLDSGVITWNRRWCLLDGFNLKYWNYPEEATDPVECIDLRYCVVQKVELANRSSCARPKTLFLPLKRSLKFEKYFLSADTQEELRTWQDELNFVIDSLLIWNGMKNDVC